MCRPVGLRGVVLPRVPTGRPGNDQSAGGDLRLGRDIGRLRQGPGLRHAVLVQLAVVGHRVDLRTPASGTVLAVHTHAVNLVVGGRLWTLLPAPGPPGPRRLQVADARLRLPVRPGAEVHVRAGRVSLSGVVADGRMAAVWSARPSVPPSRGAAARLGALEAAVGGRAWPGLRPRLLRFTTALLTDGPGSRSAD